MSSKLFSFRSLARPAIAAALALVIAPVSAGWWIGSQNTLHLGYNEPAGKTATKLAQLKTQNAGNSVNMLQEVMKTSEVANVVPGGYVYQVSALKGPSTYKEAYAFVYKSTVSQSGGLVNYPEASMDREPSGMCFWTGSAWVWCVNYHAPFDSAKLNTELPQMTTVANWFKARTSGVNDVLVGGDWNRAGTHANFNSLKSAGYTQVLPDVATSINTSGAWANAYDHFVWNPSNTSVTTWRREEVDPAYWRANVSDHGGIYTWLNY